MSSVHLRDRELVGPNGALRILYQLTPSTRQLDLSHNQLFGDDGLRALREGIVQLPGEWELEELRMMNCGLGGTRTDRSLLELTDLIRTFPHLHTLDLTNNDLQDLPLEFIDRILDHSTLHTLHLSTNLHLGPSGATERLLTRFLSSATSSPSSLTLRKLSLNDTEIPAESCGPLLERILRLGSQGLDALSLNMNPSLERFSPLDERQSFIRSTLLRSLVQIVSEENEFVQSVEMYGCSSDLAEFLRPGLLPTLQLAVERNRRLKTETRRVALEMWTVARVVLLSTGPVGDHHQQGAYRGMVDLPPEMVMPILSCFSKGALSERQVRRVIRAAADRTSLVGERRWADKDELLEAVGCSHYDC